MATNRRLGRPPSTSSEQTRLRILDAARVCFAQHGYEATTNRMLAESAQLTTGAIYHYFDSKLDLYLQTHTQVQALVYERFEAAAADAEPTFVAGITAVLDEALALNREDPTLATFLVGVRTDAERIDELRDQPTLVPHRRSDFFGGLVRLGVETGELDEADIGLVLEVIAAMLIGLSTASSATLEQHTRAVEGTKRLIVGSLIRQPTDVSG